MKINEITDKQHAINQNREIVKKIESGQLYPSWQFKYFYDMNFVVDIPPKKLAFAFYEKYFLILYKTTVLTPVNWYYYLDKSQINAVVKNFMKPARVAAISTNSRKFKIKFESSSNIDNQFLWNDALFWKLHLNSITEIHEKASAPPKAWINLLNSFNENQ